MSWRRCLQAVACALVFSNPVVAQDFSLPPMVSSVGLGNIGMSSAAIAAARAPASAADKAIPIQLAPARYFFRASGVRRKANLAKFVDKTRATDPKGAAGMAAMFAQSDPITALGVGISQFGLRTDNAADAYTVYWMTAWQAAHGDTSDFTRTQAQAVKAQAAGALAATPEFVTATDATKQEFAEAMLVQAALVAASLDTYKNDPAMMRQLGAAVRKGAKASGLDLDAMTLTEQGFVPSGKTGATEPVPGTPEQALAANDTSPPYLLLAAAGGAGLGGVFMLGKMFGRRG